MTTSLRSLLLATFILLGLVGPASARKLKVYSVPRAAVPGQMAILIIENPAPDQQRSVTSCIAPKYVGWTKSELPILRIEQNGKQVWTSIGSYISIGDSCIATFMMPVTLVPGTATLYLVNGSDPSIPYPLHVEAKATVALRAVEPSTLTGLANFTAIGDGFAPEPFNDQKKLADELEANIGLSKLSKAEQYTALSLRIGKEWDKLPVGDYLLLEQGGKSWRVFPNECGLSARGMELHFTLPPDLAKGTATATIVAKLNGSEAGRSAATTITVQ